MKKSRLCAVLFALLLFGLSTPIVSAEEVSHLPQYEQLANSRSIYRWSHNRGYSFTELVYNAYGYRVPVTFKDTGSKRVVWGQVQHYYVGIIEDTRFGVRRVIYQDVE